jgi:parallel beta-helix repeat protein
MLEEFHVKSILGIAAFVVLSLSLTAQPCPMTCPTSDDSLIQGLLDSAAAAGGGTVELEPRIYYTCKALLIKSNVHLRGAGRGATIIRGSASISGLTVDNAYLGASLGAVGADHVSVSDLTIDHATCARNANGIAFIPGGLPGDDSQAYNGTVPTNGYIARVEILGTPDYHNYMIWNLKGQHIKIVDNWVDGGATFALPQEGIESFGGHDVVISNNTVKNIGSACVNVGSAGVAGSETRGIFVENNYLSGCQVGINLGTSNENGNHLNSHTHIRGNVIREIRQIGIDVPVAISTNEVNLDISHNTIRNVNGVQAAGIRLRASGGVLDPSTTVANTIEGNLIANVRGSNAHGIRVLSYPNARILNNTIVGTDYEGIYAFDTNDAEIVGNRVEDVGTVPIGVYASGPGWSSRVVIERNRVMWSTQNAGVLAIGLTTASIRDNIFSRKGTGLPTPIVFGGGTCGTTISGNLAWYAVNWTNVSSSACP